jgi:hypothetical protein
VPEGHPGHEEAAVRIENHTDKEARKTRRTGTPPRTRSSDDCTVGGGEEKVVQTKECAGLIQEEITMQTVEALTNKVA